MWQVVVRAICIQWNPLCTSITTKIALKSDRDIVMQIKKELTINYRNGHLKLQCKFRATRSLSREFTALEANLYLHFFID